MAYTATATATQPLSGQRFTLKSLVTMQTPSGESVQVEQIEGEYSLDELLSIGQSIQNQIDRLYEQMQNNADKIAAIQAIINK